MRGERDMSDPYREKAEAMSLILSGRTFASEGEAIETANEMMARALREAAAEALEEMSGHLAAMADVSDDGSEGMRIKAEGVDFARSQLTARAASLRQEAK